MSSNAALLQGFEEGRQAPKVRVQLPPAPITGHEKQDEDSDNKYNISNRLVLLQVPHQDASGLRKPAQPQLRCEVLISPEDLRPLLFTLRRLQRHNCISELRRNKKKKKNPCVLRAILQNVAKMLSMEGSDLQPPTLEC